MAGLNFRKADDKDLYICAGIISESEAWHRYGIDFDKSVDLLSGMDDEIYIAEKGNDIAGFITLMVNGMGNFGAYIRMIAG